MTIRTIKNIPISDYPAIKLLIRAANQDVTKAYLEDEIQGLHIAGTSIAVDGTGIALTGFQTNGAVSGGLLPTLPAANWAILAATDAALMSMWKYGAGGAHYANAGVFAQPQVVGATADTTVGSGLTNSEDGTFSALVCDSTGAVTSYERTTATNAVKTVSTLPAAGAIVPGALTSLGAALQLADNTVTGAFRGFMVLDFSNDGLPATIAADLTWMLRSMRLGDGSPCPHWKGRS